MAAASSTSTVPRTLTIEQYIALRSKQLGLDPAAVLAVASQEGGFKPAPGHYDPDTQGHPGYSYGPFQLRSPGRFPSQVDPSAGSSASSRAAAFAWSKQGIDYALQGIASVAKGQKGDQAVSTIVSRFEQPADPSSEIARANRSYLDFYHYDRPGGLKGGLFSGVDLIPLPVGPVAGLETIAGGSAGAAEGAGLGAGAGAAGKTVLNDLLKKGAGAGGAALAAYLLRNYLVRALEVVGGAILVLLGLAMLGFTAANTAKSTGRKAFA